MSRTFSCLLLGVLLVLSSASVRADELGDLKIQLRDRDAYVRGKALEQLITEGGLEAWELILDALADPAGRVADQAQLALPSLPEGLREELLGKRGLRSKETLVPLRVAEALGRMEVRFTEPQYIKALKTRDPDVLRSLLWSLERLAHKGLIGTGDEALVEELHGIVRKGKHPLTQAHALLALHGLDEVAATALAGEALVAKQAPLRAASIEVLSAGSGTRRAEALGVGASDEVLMVRVKTYELAAKRPDLADMKILIDALEREQNARAVWRLVGLLREASGTKYARDTRSWRRWYSEQEESWAPAKRSERGDLGEEGTVSFVGMPVLSTRLAFLIDFSGSMWEERDGKTRKQRVDVELRKALEGLNPDVTFNLHPFESTPLRWQKKLTKASKRNVKRAIEYFEGCNAKGKGDFWAALQEAMQDPDVDTFMVLGDGAPSGGTRWNMALMKELFAHENRFRGIALDALLVDCSRGLSSHWIRMAEESGGRCLNVEL